MGARQGGRAGQAHRLGRERSGRPRADRPDRRPARQPARWRGPDQGRRAAAARVQGPGRDPAPAGQGAGADRSQGDRLDDPDRPRPARADHRRPHHRQDCDPRRHDPQPARAGPDLHLRRDRPEGLDRRAGAREAEGGGGDGLHDHRPGRRLRGRADQVDGAVRGLRDGRVLHVQGPARARDVRRPLQARRRVPADVAAAPPPARPRGLPGRRLLPALAAARARVQALRRAGRRVADRAAGGRDAGGRRLRLHPDQRDLDHGRPDLPRVRALLLGRAPGDQRRHLRLARGRLGPDQGDEQGRRQPQARPLAVPRARGVRAVRLRARPVDAEDPRPRRAAGRVAEPAAVRPVAGRGTGRRCVRRREGLPGRDPGRRRAALPRRSCATTSAPRSRC